jgi:hypothetical protein
VCNLGFPTTVTVVWDTTNADGVQIVVPVDGGQGGGLFQSPRGAQQISFPCGGQGIPIQVTPLRGDFPIDGNTLAGDKAIALVTEVVEPN